MTPPATVMRRMKTLSQIFAPKVPEGAFENSRIQLLPKYLEVFIIVFVDTNGYKNKALERKKKLKWYCFRSKKQTK